MGELHAQRSRLRAAIRASTDVREPGTDIDALVRTKVAAVTSVSAAVPLIGAFGATLNALAVVLGLSLGALVGILTLSGLPGDYAMRLVEYIRFVHLSAATSRWTRAST